jgi:hypothetical protein
MSLPCCECGKDSNSESSEIDIPDAFCGRCGKPMCADCYDNAEEFFEGQDTDCTEPACTKCMEEIRNQK